MADSNGAQLLFTVPSALVLLVVIELGPSALSEWSLFQFAQSRKLKCGSCSRCRRCLAQFRPLWLYFVSGSVPIHRLVYIVIIHSRKELQFVVSFGPDRLLSRSLVHRPTRDRP